MIQLKINLANGMPCESCTTKCSDCQSEIMPNKIMLERRLKGMNGILKTHHSMEEKKTFILDLDNVNLDEVKTFIEKMGFTTFYK